MNQPEQPNTIDPVELANRLFEENYIACFWHMRRDLPITRESIPMVLNGLRPNGGRQQYLDAARLEALASGTPGSQSLTRGYHPVAEAAPTATEPPGRPHGSPGRVFEPGEHLHLVDQATNQLLILAGGPNLRAYIDIIHLDESFLSLGAIAWAACGKNDGVNPVSLLEYAKRHTRYTRDELAAAQPACPLTLPDLKQKWLAAVDRAEALFPRLPAEDVGCLYLTADSTPVTPDPDSPAFPTLRRHFGSLRGAWPTIATP